MTNLTTPAGVITHMSAATSRLDWLARRLEVQMANDNRDPSFWYDKIVVPNLYGRTVGAQSGSQS